MRNNIMRGGVGTESVNNRLFRCIFIINIIIVIIIQFANNSERCESNSNIDRLKIYMYTPYTLSPLAFKKTLTV